MSRKQYSCWELSLHLFKVSTTKTSGVSDWKYVNTWRFAWRKLRLPPSLLVTGNCKELGRFLTRIFAFWNQYRSVIRCLINEGLFFDLRKLVPTFLNHPVHNLIRHTRENLAREKLVLNSFQLNHHFFIVKAKRIHHELFLLCWLL